MTDDAAAAEIARRAAARLAADLDPGLPDQVEHALADDPLARAPERTLDPISLGSLLVSLAALGWTIYRDLKADRAAARADHAAGADKTAGADRAAEAGRMIPADRAADAERLAARLREDAATAVRLPTGVTPAQRLLVIRVIAEEIAAADPPLR